jgi:ubiquinone/menaquinone biosynthesis C-methylase UbiE
MPDAGRHEDEVVSQFTQQAEGYAKLVGSMRRRENPALAALAPGADDIALDVACGSGSLTLQIAERVRHVTGIDLTPAMIEQARAAQAERGIANIDWRIGTIAALPFADGAFSLVTCSAAFHHLERPQQVLMEMRRVCRPGGRIAVIDVAPPADKAAAFDRLERLRDPSHTHANSPEELHAIGAACGLGDPVTVRYGSAIPFEAVLATSYPTETSIDHIRALIEADAHGGADGFGLTPELRDGQLYVSYPMMSSVWAV